VRFKQSEPLKLVSKEDGVKSAKRKDFVSEIWQVLGFAAKYVFILAICVQTNLITHQSGWKWSFPGEPKGYRDWQEQRRKEIMELYHYQERLDNWVQYTTARTVKNFTELGFAVVDSPPELYARMKKRLHDSMASGKTRIEQSGKPQGIYGDNVPLFVDHGNHIHTRPKV
jgi:hypothetical protein